MSPATVWALLTIQVLPGPLPLRLPSIAVSGRTPAPVTSCPTADRAGIHGADSKHSISLCHRFRWKQSLSPAKKVYCPAPPGVPLNWLMI